jgi:4-amino-4-deoxy-L-arabinose transferase-like glycosyltransferase
MYDRHPDGHGAAIAPFNAVCRSRRDIERMSIRNLPFLQQPHWSAILLLLPLIALLPAIPIDETRYVAVAWEMHLSGNYLVPHLNGAVYSDKPPLLFWLINAGWWLSGIHLWTARALGALFSVVSLILLSRLTQRLTGSDAAARTSGWILLGSVYFATFAAAIMFDVALTSCVLLAVHGICDLLDGRYRRGIVIAGVAIGLGILAKGPVVLLDTLFIGLAAPWWSLHLDGRRTRYYVALAAAVLLGIAIGLAWAVPAASYGGADYARAIFLHQTIDRVQGAGVEAAHRRPVWYYLVVFPLMLLPWPLVLRGRWHELKALAGDPAVRLALVWALPTLLVFSVIAGKQPHYLLPLLPGVALACAAAWTQSAFTIRMGLLATVLALLGIGLAVAPNAVSLRSDYADISHTLSLTLACIVWAGAAAAWWWRRTSSAMPAALIAVAIVVALQLALLRTSGSYDVTPAAEKIRAAQESQQAIAMLGLHHGVFEFAGRLRQPLLELDSEAAFTTWAAQHPDGLVVSFYRKYRFAATPIFSQPFRGSQLSIWRVRDALASGLDVGATRVDESDAAVNERVQ